MKAIKNGIEIIIQKWCNFIDRKAEIKVCQKRDLQGNSYWLAFNPITKSYSYFYTEAEVKMWIDRSYYADIEKTRF